MKLEEALVSVWRQVLEENANLVELASERFPVQRTAKKRLRQVDFTFNGEEMRGIEQNPATRSRWAELARQGHRVMQFTAGGRFFANVVDGSVNLYRKSPGAKPGTRRAEG